MGKTKYTVTVSFLENIIKLTNFDSLQSGKLPDTFNYDNKCFVTVGSHSSGAAGIIRVLVHEVVPIDKYTGKVKPLPYWEHHNEVDQKKRERGYHAQLLTKGNKKFVLIDPMIDFLPAAEPKQLEIF